MTRGVFLRKTVALRDDFFASDEAEGGLHAIGDRLSLLTCVWLGESGLRGNTVFSVAGKAPLEIHSLNQP